MKTTRTRTLAHLAATLLLGFGIVAGLFAGAATPASAASAVSGCFVWDTGTAYANQPVHLQQQSRGRWTTIRSGKTNSRGCATFTRTPTTADAATLPAPHPPRAGSAEVSPGRGPASRGRRGRRS